MIKIITISREFGSGGRTIGKEVADKLGIPCYDKDLIEELAEKGACVIVGRCADYVLRERKDVLNVFVYADKKYRAERIVKKYGESRMDPEKRLDDKDKKRKLNYKYFTEQEWGKRQNYHLSIDSGFLGIEKSVALIADAIGGAMEHE